MKAQMPNAVDWYSSLLKPNQVYCSLWLIKQTTPFIVSKCVPFNQVYWIARLFQIGKLLESETQIHSIFILLLSSIFIFLLHLKWKSLNQCFSWRSSPSLPSTCQDSVITILAFLSPKTLWQIGNFGCDRRFRQIPTNTISLNQKYFQFIYFRYKWEIF